MYNPTVASNLRMKNTVLNSISSGFAQGSTQTAQLPIDVVAQANTPAQPSPSEIAAAQRRERERESGIVSRGNWWKIAAIAVGSVALFYLALKYKLLKI